MKHVVMETGKHYAVVLNGSGEFIKIRNNNYTVGQEITLPKSNSSAMFAIAASFVFLLLSTFSGYHIYSAPEEYISIDINPSIQLVTNRFNKVIEVQSFNSDGEIVLEQSKIKHQSLENSIEKIIDISKDLGYLSEENNNVVIDVVAKSENTVIALQQKTEKYREESIVVEIEETNGQMLELSKELGTSLGRTKAIYDYTDSNGGDIKENKKKLEQESVADIKNRGASEKGKNDPITKQSEKEENHLKNKENPINKNNGMDKNKENKQEQKNQEKIEKIEKVEKKIEKTEKKEKEKQEKEKEKDKKEQNKDKKENNKKKK